MDKDRYSEDYQQKLLRVVLIISLMAICAYFIMLLISPESKNLARFLFGFGIFFTGIVVFAFCVKYTIDLYKQIMGKKK